MLRRNDADNRATRVQERDRARRLILGLPWVVERPRLSAAPGVATFAIDCKPLGIRQIWLVSGLQGGLAIVVPTELAEDLRLTGLASPVAPMPLDHTLVRVAAGFDPDELARIVLASYEAVFRTAER